MRPPAVSDIKRARRWSQLCVAAVVLAGCSSDKSFALLSVLANEGELTGVAQLRVDVRNGALTDRLFYPRTPTANLTLSKDTPVTLSVSFKTSYRGLLEIGVTALSAGGQPLGFGTTAQAIDPGHVVRATVIVVAGAIPPESLDPRDGGASGDGGSPTARDASGDSTASTFNCEPTAPSSCGQNRTCFVGCRGELAMGLCTMAGAKPPGETCKDNSECQPGSQCFEFPCAGVSKPRMCMRFCKEDGDCGADRRCLTNVPCGKTPSGNKVCSHTCDPRGEGKTGCPDGLRCFVFPGETPDCDCLGDSRTGGDGDTCMTAANCKPGFLCVSTGTGNPTTCRPICRLDANDCAAGRTCTKLLSPDYKMFGACF